MKKRATESALRPQVDWSRAPEWAEFWLMDGAKGMAFWGCWGRSIRALAVDDFARGMQRTYTFGAQRKRAPSFGWPRDRTTVDQRPKA